MVNTCSLQLRWPYSPPTIDRSATVVIEFLNVNGEMVSHIVVPITGDGACLFNSLSYLMYGTEQMAREIRKLIVSHVTKNWTEFSVMSHDNNGNNYMSSAEYFADMSQLYIYGGLCELVAKYHVILALSIRLN